MDSKNGIDLVLWCGVGGLYFESFYEKDIGTFVEKCAEAGVTRLIPSFYISPVKSHRWLIRHLEVEAAYEPYEYGEKSPLKVLVRHAHDCGLEVHPHVPLGSEGGWMRVSPVGELGVFARMSKFARDHPEYWTKTQDGRGWLDVNRREKLAGSPGIGLFPGTGFISLAFPEVREYARSLFIEYVQDYGVDGVQLEFIIPPTDDRGSYLLGYDEPAMTAFEGKYGQDPREIDNSDDSWMRFRAGYFTQFVRELREALSKPGAEVELSVATEATDGIFNEPSRAYKMMFDWPTWVEEQLIDVLYPRFWLTPPMWWPVAPPEVAEELSTIKKQIGDKCQVIAGLVCLGGNDNIAELTERAAGAALDEGADGLGVYRADAVEAFGLWGMLENLSSADARQVS